YSSRRTSPTNTSPLSLHDALPISTPAGKAHRPMMQALHWGLTCYRRQRLTDERYLNGYMRQYESALGRPRDYASLIRSSSPRRVDRKSTRLNSSHVSISYAVFCLK